MRKLTKSLFFAGIIAINLAAAASKASASSLKHVAAYDPAQDKWIVVCTECIISCNCEEKET